MVEHHYIELQTKEYNEWILITDNLNKICSKSEISNGVMYVISKHTTTGVTVNESLECLESDLRDMLERLIPENHPYAHARILSEYGSTAGNPTGHLKSHLTGNHCVLPIIDGVVSRGGAQDIYFCEFDGPASRTVTVTIIGE
jgi:secondary thiamine-phosphate synthase enzyme